MAGSTVPYVMEIWGRSLLRCGSSVAEISLPKAFPYLSHFNDGGGGSQTPQASKCRLPIPCEPTSVWLIDLGGIAAALPDSDQRSVLLKLKYETN